MVFYFGWFFFLLGGISLYLGLLMMNYVSFVVEVFSPSFLVFNLSLSFYFDYISLFFFSCVSFISGVVFLYSKYYMGVESIEVSDVVRFLLLLFLFVISMFFLVFSFSWFTVMLGWDGLGVVSFLLVIYFNDSKSLDSGLLTVFTNRLGDCFFLLGVVFMFFCGWFSFDFLSIMSISLFCVILMFGCITKSAQMPFSSWLPAAMAAPTPVSSLVHSSTLVTAGIYLLVRFNFLLSSSFYLLMVISLLTMLLASGFAMYELDFKKIVAMSTLSQLGFMVFSISVGSWLLAFMHMMFHAFFKSTLFLSTGNLMHFISGNQDTRYFGNFYMSFFSKVFFSMSCLSLMGFPFSLGFYSKDNILGYCLFYSGHLMSLLFCLFCCLTVAYSLRLMDLGFLKFSFFDNSLSFNEALFFYLPVIFLFFLNIFVGNFFMFFYLPCNNIYSFFELFVGVLVMSGGFLLFKKIPSYYSLVFSFGSMIYLPFLMSKLNFTSYNKFYYKDDLTWNELFSAKGVSFMFESLDKNFSTIFNINFFYLGLLIFTFYNLIVH